MKLSCLMGPSGLLCYCIVSALAVMTGTVLWMDENSPPLRADEALQQAEQSVQNYCRHQGMSQCTVKLVDATAPAKVQQNMSWQFKFQSPQLGALQVQVGDSGKVKLISSRLQPRGQALPF